MLHCRRPATDPALPGFRRILVPLDGSEPSERALPFAAALARAAGAEIVAVRVHVPYALMYADVMAPFAYTQDEREEERERQHLEVLGRVVQVRTVMAEGPDVARAVCREADELQADLIVMTTHGRSLFWQMWLGGTTDRVFHQALQPVLVLPPSIRPPPEPPCRLIMVALDGTSRGEHALALATRLAASVGAGLALVRVYGDSRELPGETGSAEARRREAREYLDRVRQGLVTEGFRVQSAAVPADNPGLALLTTARHLEADLVALETRARGAWPRLLLGSLADRLVHSLEIPVLVHCSHVTSRK